MFAVGSSRPEERAVQLVRCSRAHGGQRGPLKGKFFKKKYQFFKKKNNIGYCDETYVLLYFPRACVRCPGWGWGGVAVGQSGVSS